MAAKRRPAPDDNPAPVLADVEQGIAALERTLAAMEPLAVSVRAAVALARTQLAALRVRAEMGKG